MKNLEKYIDRKRASNCTEATISNYILCLEALYKYLKLKRVNKDSQITNDIVLEYINLLLKKNSANTVATKVSIIKSYLQYLSVNNIIHPSIPYNINPIRKEAKLPHALEHYDIVFVIEKLKQEAKKWIEYRNMTLIAFLYDTGVRTSEAIAIRASDIKPDSNTIEIIGKGNKSRIVIYSDATRRHLEDLIKRNHENRQDNEHLFINKNNQALTRDTVYRIVHQTFSRFGYKIRGAHDLRHSFATHMINTGAEQCEISKLLGHEDPKTTQIYAKVSINKLIETHTKFHKF